MSWELLPVNYTDAVWSGLKKFNEIDNGDGTVSFQDVTVYSQKENSFFGAREANRMNEALNTLMSMVEGGTDLYTAFQNYFNTQKNLFEGEADTKLSDLQTYVAGLEAQGDALIEQIETDYSAEMTQFKNTQQSIFTVWFDTIRGQLGSDVAGQLQNEIDALTEKEFLHYYGLVNKTTVIEKNGASTTITETGDGVVATTVISTVAAGKQIVTEVVPATGGYNYTKTVLIADTATGKEITETFTKEVQS